MSSSEWSGINDAEFDSILKNSLPEPPPDDIAEEVTPWRRSINQVLTGLSLNVITFEFFGLNYILPTIGAILMLLGFRTLRRENGWFRLCHVITILRTIYLFPTLIINATIYQSAFYALPLVTVLTALSTALAVLQIFGFWRAFRAAKAKAGLEKGALPAAALLLWYIAIIALALSGLGGGLISIAMIVVYFIIVRGLARLSKTLDGAGYAITAAPVRVSGQSLVIALSAILIIGIACTQLFCDSHPMEWTPLEAAESEEVREVKAQLRELGFPDEVLEDLAEEDILACRDAVDVVSEVTDYPFNSGREVREMGEGTTFVYTEYDVRELRITAVAVELPGEREEMRIFHHFRWIVDPGFQGTEAVQLWPTYGSHAGGWTASGDVTGRVLYTKRGESYAAPYHSLGAETYSYTSVFGEYRTVTEIFGAFSMPGGGENKRGYVAYSAVLNEDSWLLISYLNYTHQRSFMQYPARTAVDFRKSGAFSGDVFHTVQDSLVLKPTEDGFVLAD